MEMEKLKRTELVVGVAAYAAMFLYYSIRLVLLVTIGH